MNVFNYILKDEQLPLEWKTAYISNLHKKRQQEDTIELQRTKCNELYLNVIWKTYQRRTESQYNAIVEQDGFRACRPCIDNIFTLK